SKSTLGSRLHLLLESSQALNADTGVQNIEMAYDNKGQLSLVIYLRNNDKYKIPTAIMNPDGHPYPPSPLNPIQLVFGPIKCIPLAIEKGSKAVTYNASTGYHTSTYSDKKQLEQLHIKALCSKIRVGIEKPAIMRQLKDSPHVAGLYSQYQNAKSKDNSQMALEPPAIKNTDKNNEGNGMDFYENHFK
ncbi:MAG: hypothetical protein ACPGEF_01225, partial [Endozoicomonas sp.]